MVKKISGKMGNTLKEDANFWLLSRWQLLPSRGRTQSFTQICRMLKHFCATTLTKSLSSCTGTGLSNNLLSIWFSPCTTMLIFAMDSSGVPTAWQFEELTWFNTWYWELVSFSHGVSTMETLLALNSNVVQVYLRTVAASGLKSLQLYQWAQLAL